MVRARDDMALINMADKQEKRKKISKKSKKSWRKHTDITDIEEHLEEKRREERSGWVFFFLNAVQQIIDSETHKFSTPRGILDVFLRFFHFNIVGTISQH